MPTTAYQTDFYAWTQEQATALRRIAELRINLPEVDLENVAEEIESMGRSDRLEINSRLEVLLEHLLKLACSADTDPRSGWRRTVREQRRRILDCLSDSPSLRTYPSSILERSYHRAQENAADDTSLGPLPVTCPWELDAQILAENWYPSAPPTTMT
ncbi:conserved hypothetical protein [uncultured Gammaproteobacteria bacterium]